MSIKQLSVFLENKPGRLEKMTSVLAESGISLRAMSMAETKDFGVVRMIVDNSYKASTILRDAGYVYSLTPVIIVVIPDEPGSLSKVLKIFADENVNLEYMYAGLGAGRASSAYLIFRVTDTQTAEKALRKAGIKVVEDEELIEQEEE